MITSSKKRFVEYSERCPKCGKGPPIEDYICGEILCSSCGYIIKESEIDIYPEWRAFTKEEREAKARVGIPLSLAVFDKSLATMLDDSKRDASGRRLTHQERVMAQRMKKWDIRSQMEMPSHRNLKRALTELDKSADKLKVSNNVVERAAYIYRKALKKNLVRGRSILSIITASLYAACRETDTPRTLNDVIEASGVEKKDVARSYRLLLRELKLKMPVVVSLRYVSKIANKATIPERTSRKALETLKEAKRTKISAGKDPIGLAASALYIACLLDGRARTQKEIAKAAGVTEVTIRNRYKSLREGIRSTETTELERLTIRQLIRYQKGR